MGALMDVRCSTFVLPETAFDAAFAALKSVVEDRPDEFHEPDDILAADDLLAALDAEGWNIQRSGADLERVWYGGDKAPSNSDEEWPFAMIEALSAHATAAEFQIFCDGEKIFTLELEDGVLELR